jgi:hypothetical protein
MNTQRKPNPDHKRKPFSYGVAANCSCGWQSSVWFGKGGRYSANNEWHTHREKCEKAAGSSGQRGQSEQPPSARWSS